MTEFEAASAAGVGTWLALAEEETTDEAEAMEEEREDAYYALEDEQWLHEESEHPEEDLEDGDWEGVGDEFEFPD